MIADFRPASLKRRFAALLYESLLLGGLTVLAALAAGTIVTALNSTPWLARTVVSLMLLGAWWWYCHSNWQKKGQTLPMKVWHIRLTNTRGQAPSSIQITLRFLWACLFLILIPALAYLGLRHNGIAPKPAAGAALCWWILPWGFALLHPQRQFLYDHLAGTVLAADSTKPR